MPHMVSLARGRLHVHLAIRESLSQYEHTAFLQKKRIENFFETLMSDETFMNCGPASAKGKVQPDRVYERIFRPLISFEPFGNRIPQAVTWWFQKIST